MQRRKICTDSLTALPSLSHHRLQLRQPTRCSPRLSITMSGRLHSWQVPAMAAPLQSVRPHPSTVGNPASLRRGFLCRSQWLRGLSASARHLFSYRQVAAVSQRLAYRCDRISSAGSRSSAFERIDPRTASPGAGVRRGLFMRNPAADCAQTGFPLSGSVVAELWLPHMVRFTRCVRGRTISHASIELA
jgi:hypothetical protein